MSNKKCTHIKRPLTVTVTTSNIDYDGFATCLGINPGDDLSTILAKISEKVCEIPGGGFVIQGENESNFND